MSLDITSYVVYGVAVKQKDFHDKATRYDENTGTPYLKEVTRTGMVLLSTDEEIDTTHLDEDAYQFGDFGMVYMDHARYDHRVIGTIISRTDTSEKVEVLRQEVLDHTNKKLAELGITEAPALYIITNYSY